MCEDIYSKYIALCNVPSKYLLCPYIPSADDESFVKACLKSNTYTVKHMLKNEYQPMYKYVLINILVDYDNRAILHLICHDPNEILENDMCYGWVSAFKRAAHNNDISMFDHLMNTHTSSYKDVFVDSIYDACSQGHVGMIDHIISAIVFTFGDDYGDYEYLCNMAMGGAVICDDPDILQYIQKINTISEYKCDLLYAACKHGNLSIVQLLVDLVELDLTVVQYAMKSAAKYGHPYIIEYLFYVVLQQVMNRLDVWDEDMYRCIHSLLKRGCRHGHLNVVKSAIEISNQEDSLRLSQYNIDNAIKLCRKSSHLNIMEYLSKYSLPRT
jgi:hypothetical protein